MLQGTDRRMTEHRVLLVNPMFLLPLHSCVELYRFRHLDMNDKKFRILLLRRT